MGELVTAQTAAQVELADVGERVRAYLAGSVAPATARAYRADFADFAAWCEGHGLAALPAAPESVALYLAALAETHAPATLTRRLSAVSVAHQAAGHESPTAALVVRKALAGIRRAKGAAPAAKAPLTVADLRAIVAHHLPAGAKGVRDRALLLVGFAAALRRSELVGIDAGHLAFVPEGLVLTIPRSKTDQEGAGQRIAVPYGAHAATCPVRALRAWLELAAVTDGPVFRRVDRHGNVGAGRLTGRAVALVVQGYAAALGRDASDFGGHSLRAGFATAAAREGVAERDIQRQTRHKSLTVLRGYIREGELFRANAAAALGL